MERIVSIHMYILYNRYTHICLIRLQTVAGHETTRLRTHSRTLVVDWSPTCARLRKVVGMSEKEFLIDAVAQFLQSAKWLDAIAGFLETHYRPFLPTETAVDQKASSSPSETETAENSEGEDAKEATTGHSLQQYDTFLQFKDLVERLLEALIAELGCSGEDLVSILEASARLGVSASRERCFFIKTLLSFESYHAFYRKISQFAAEKQGGSDVVSLYWLPDCSLLGVRNWSGFTSFLCFPSLSRCSKWLRRCGGRKRRR